MSKKFKVTFIDVIEAETEMDAVNEIRDMCDLVAINGDVTAFKFEEIED